MGMFERYTEQARRAVFYSRVEAVARGATAISTIDLLLGVTRELDSRACRLQSVQARLADLHGLIGVPAKIPERRDLRTKQDLVLEDDTKRALAFAAMEAEPAAQPIDTDSLLIGILCFANQASQKLQDLGINLYRARLDASELEKLSPRRRASRLAAFRGNTEGIRQALSHLALLFAALRLFAALIEWINW